MFYMIGGGFVAVRGTDMHVTYKELHTALIVPIILATVAALVMIGAFQKHFYIQRAGLNPFKNIYRVLKYAWKHKVPERRSALHNT